MARERWFYAPTHKRQGPVALAQLVEGLLRLPDPRTCLVWKHGLPAWTPAGDVAEVDQHLAPFVVARKAATSSHSERHVETGAAVRGEARSERPRTRAGAARAKAAGPSPIVYVGAGAGLVVLAILVWLFWPSAPRARTKTAGDATAPGIITLKDGEDAGDGTATPAGPGAGQAGFAGWSDEEKFLPPTELAKLNSVAAWSDKSIEVTLYNGSNWRITQLFVTPNRLVQDNFVADSKEISLLPVGIAVEEGVDQLMNKVAPNRRKPGVNPLDTGKFVGQAGSRPEAFRAPISRARGYPPK